ncbi:MAG: superoxide dismutase [Bacteroidales bacterium]|nr:superoxide dismutase [Bacteroidales bacterium]
MNKREFIKSGLLGVGATLMLPSVLASKNFLTNDKASVTGKFFEQPPLGFAFDALEPYIDAKTMEIHYLRHHAAYTRVLNEQLSKVSVPFKSIVEIMENISQFPVSVRNNGGGYLNHNLFWKIITPGGAKLPSGELMTTIEKTFGSFDAFKSAFIEKAMSVFGSGWAWVIKTPYGLKITSTANQDNPLMDTEKERGIPVLMVDVWEHAYYLKYQNRRKEYLDAFWQVVNWDQVNSFYHLDRFVL